MSASPATRSDRVRQVVVSVSYVACVIGTLFGIGVLGTAVENSSGGVLSAEATLIAPAQRAFSIWSVIYTGLLAYTIWQWLPGRGSSERARATGYLAVWSLLLNAAWIFVTQAGQVWLSVVVILALAVDLALILFRLTASKAQDWAEKLIVDGTFGAYLGWVSVASIANIAAALVGSGMSATEGPATALTVIMLVVAIAIGVIAALVFKGRIAFAIALGWGLAWIAVGRLTVAPLSTPVGIVAGIAAVAVLAAAVAVRLRRQPALAA